MAYEIRVFDFTLIASADLTDEQYHFVSVNTDGYIALTGAGDRAVGVLQNDADDGEASSVRQLGISKLVAGGTIDAGDEVESGALGVALVQDTGEANAIALEDAVEGDIFSALLLP